MANGVTLLHLERTARYWQHVLRLMDWDITVQFVHSSDIPGLRGRNDIDPVARNCAIRISNPKYEKDGFNWEQTLVHEMLHCHFAAVDTQEGTDDWLSMEQGIDTVAVSLLRLAYAER